MSHWRSLVTLIALTLALTLLPSLKTAAQLTPPAGPTFEQRLLELVNQERWRNGRLPPLKNSHALELAAESHSQRMATYNFLDNCDLVNNRAALLARPTGHIIITGHRIMGGVRRSCR